MYIKKSGNVLEIIMMTSKDYVNKDCEMLKALVTLPCDFTLTITFDDEIVITKPVRNEDFKVVLTETKVIKCEDDDVQECVLRNLHEIC